MAHSIIYNEEKFIDFSKYMGRGKKIVCEYRRDK